jgi:3-hydroxybutyryl-CoA dehydrogenase
MSHRQNVLIIGDNALADEFVHLISALDSMEIVSFEQDGTSDNSIDLVIETTNLDLTSKKEHLVQIEQWVNPETLILTSVLGVTATQSASWLTYPNRLVGLATFSNQNAKLIEIAPALQTSSEHLALAGEVILSLGKEYEIVEDEVGLVFPRILSMIINEAAFTLMEGTATAVDIDTAMTKGTNYPIGPLRWADLIGIDDVLAVLSGLHRELGEERYRPAPLLRKMVYAGWLGENCGKGFYEYEKQDMKERVG